MIHMYTHDTHVYTRYTCIHTKHMYTHDTHVYIGYIDSFMSKPHNSILLIVQERDIYPVDKVDNFSKSHF